jgi:RNA polymerase sigma-70 factor, ECF subfamily
LLDEHEQLAVIDGLRAGSRDAWAGLYDSYSVEVWRYVARLVGPDTSAVADVVQETFLEAAHSARRFDPGRGSLWSWLVGIAHYRAAAHWRQANRQARVRQMAETGKVSVRHWFDGQLDVRVADDARETAEFVRSVLAQISSDYASLLTAKYLDDRSLADIAAQFGGSVAAIKSKLARARHEFRAKFEFLVKDAEAAPKAAAAEERSAAEQHYE